MMAKRDQILDYCQQRLDVDAFQDVAVNGLQVAGSADIERLAVAVSTSLHTLTAADDWGADALLVHHGLLWGSAMQPLTGLFADRLRILFQNDINLIAYHLPLDAHKEIGNSALLAGKLGFEQCGTFGSVAGKNIGILAEAQTPMAIAFLTARIESLLDREPLVVGSVDPEPLHRVGVVTGSGYSFLHEASAAGCNALITGDIREPTMAEARELGLQVIAAGHEATERFGVQALAAELSDEFEVEYRFFHDPNPV